MGGVLLKHLSGESAWASDVRREDRPTPSATRQSLHQIASGALTVLRRYASVAARGSS
jgi:hypothetical protein